MSKLEYKKTAKTSQNRSRKPNYKRLEKLANHLLNGQLGHERFSFWIENTGDYIKRYERNSRLRYCKTAGCALGECPFVFKEWGFNYHGLPTVISLPDALTKECAQVWFNINQDAVEHLFYPDEQMAIFGGSKLHDHSTRKQVARNILRFIQKCKSYPEVEKAATESK